MLKTWVNEYPSHREHKGGVKYWEIGLPVTLRTMQFQEEKDLKKEARTKWPQYLTRKLLSYLPHPFIPSAPIQWGRLEGAIFSPVQPFGCLWLVLTQGFFDWGAKGSPMTQLPIFVASGLGRLFLIGTLFGPVTRLTADGTLGWVLHPWKWGTRGPGLWLALKSHLYLYMPRLFSYFLILSPGFQHLVTAVEDCSFCGYHFI